MSKSSDEFDLIEASATRVTPWPRLISQLTRARRLTRSRERDWPESRRGIRAQRYFPRLFCVKRQKKLAHSNEPAICEKRKERGKKRGRAKKIPLVTLICMIMHMLGVSMQFHLSPFPSVRFVPVPFFFLSFSSSFFSFSWKKEVARL